jgi:Ca2+-binding EF-hand superfamily protein
MPFDHEPECGERPPELDDIECAHDAFAMIDTDGSGKLSAEEGFEALYCLVVWEEISEEEAFAIYDHVGSHAGEDEEVDIDEFEVAVGEMMGATEEEIAAAIEAAN